jgi:uncharacterized membrane protein YfcA
MEPFSWVTALAVFSAYCVIDWLSTEYTLAVVELKKMKAANVSAVMYILLAYGVVNYVGDWRFAIPMILGGWLGTYLSVWRREHDDMLSVQEALLAGERRVP